MSDLVALNSYMHIDLSDRNADLNTIRNQSDLAQYVTDKKKRVNKTFAYGGYGEKRTFYQSQLFQYVGEARNIHLALDIWAEAGTELFTPLDAEVFSIQYNNKSLDYGHTLILQHFEMGKKFYSLAGHLSASIGQLWKKGDEIKKSQFMAQIGDINKNGGWCPHVHFQLILDLHGNIGDYPGVCSEVDKEFYFNNCPDPTPLIIPKV